jgi:hypothetical protein
MDQYPEEDQPQLDPEEMRRLEEAGLKKVLEMEKEEQNKMSKVAIWVAIVAVGIGVIYLIIYFFTLYLENKHRY